MLFYLLIWLDPSLLSVTNKVWTLLLLFGHYYIIAIFWNYENLITLPRIQLSKESRTKLRNLYSHNSLHHHRHRHR